MKIRNAFTMIELIFVIVVMGIIGKFGVEFLAQAYKSFIFTNINNSLQTTSSSAVEMISSRLEGRIKDSVIARTGANTSFTALGSVVPTTEYTVLEWVSADTDGYRGTTQPLWSGIIDLDNASATSSLLISPETNTSALDTLIGTLSNGGSGIDNAALYFIGSNNDINGYGWNGTALADQTSVMHPINDDATNFTAFVPAVGTFSGVDVYEYFKLAWTANAIVMEDYNITNGSVDYAGKNMGDLYFYHDYQPWNGDLFYQTGKNIKRTLLMKQVSSFQFMSVGSIIKIQVCTKSLLVDGDNDNAGYSLCKDKTIF